MCGADNQDGEATLIIIILPHHFAQQLPQRRSGRRSAELIQGREACRTRLSGATLHVPPFL